MMTAKKPPAKHARYHHGDLRTALINAAEQLVREQGSWNFTLREVARAAGVSHNAPYNHFADKQALLATIATRAFMALGRALEAQTDCLSEAAIAQRIEAAAIAYVEYATEQPARFRLMFSADLAQSDDSELRKATTAAFARLDDLIKQGVAAGELRSDPYKTHSLAAWSLVHGLSNLIIDGRAAGGESKVPVRIIAGVIGSTLIEGLLDHAKTS